MIIQETGSVEKLKNGCRFGPTGSDKITTLLSALNFINTPERKIRTAENPVAIKGGMTTLLQDSIHNTLLGKTGIK